MERNKKSKYVLTNDPSLTAWGWCVVDDQDKVVGCGCIKTEAQNKKLRIRKGDDDVRRVEEIAITLKAIIERYNVAMVISELPHGSQNASGAKMQGIVMGILATISEFTQIPTEWYSEADAKKALLNKRSATKTQVKDAISTKYTINWKGVMYKDEAIADAMAVYHVATQKSQLLRMLRSN